MSQTVQIEDITDVDLLFMIDNSGSMKEEQKKLRDEFPRMISALVTGDIDGDGMQDGPAVESLRVAVITSDMGINGAGWYPPRVDANGNPVVPEAASFSLSTCNSTKVDANYGDDGLFRTAQRTVYADPSNPTTMVVYDCDQDATAGDDVVAATALPTYLTFPGTNGGDPALTDDVAGRTEYTRRISCFANVGTQGCEFEQQLETVLKAITPGTRTPVGGAFYQAPGDTGRDVGHGDNATTNGSWFRDPTRTLLAIVEVTDEEDSSSPTQTVFNYTTSDTIASRDDDNVTTNGASAAAGPTSTVTFMPPDGISIQQALATAGVTGTTFTEAQGVYLELEADGNRYLIESVNGNSVNLMKDPVNATGAFFDAGGAEVLNSVAGIDTVKYWVKVRPAGTTSYDDPNAFEAFQRQTRAQRYSELLHDTDRYVQGFLATRLDNPRLLVYAAITGVPPDLTDDEATNEGASNLDAILLDPRMAYVLDPRDATLANQPVRIPDVDLRPACSHRPPSELFTATLTTTSGSRTATLTVATAPTPATVSFNAIGNVVDGATADQATNVTVSGFTPTPGMSITGTGIPQGTVVTLVRDNTGNGGPYNLVLSSDATAGTGVTLTLNAERGPGIGMAIEASTLPAFTTITAVTGPTAAGGVLNNSYTVILSTEATGTGTATAATLGFLDVEAAPARRLVEVARGLRDATDIDGNAVVQSICVDDFRPAISRILRAIQSNLGGSCLPRPLVRNANFEVNCDVFVTLPPNTDCDPALGYVFQKTVPAAIGGLDTDGVLQRCVVNQVPVTAADGTSGLPPTSANGWFYDDYTVGTNSVTEACPNSPQRVSFTGLAEPPQGSQMQFGCAQPVQDGELSIDINAACNDVANNLCRFTDDAAAQQFILRYNLPASFDYNLVGDASTTGDFVCEYDTQTCQIACDTNADCPGGFECYDQPLDDNALQGRGLKFCVNPTCGSGD